MSTYSFLDVHAAIVGPGGAFSVGSGAGVADEGISVQMSGEKNTMTIGADGKGMHSLHADKSGKITIRLLKTSAANAQLSLLYNFQTQSSTLHGQNTITVTDFARGDVVSARNCAFVKQPDLTYAKDANIVEWEFHSTEIDEILGVGN